MDDLQPSTIERIVGVELVHAEECVDLGATIKVQSIPIDDRAPIQEQPHLVEILKIDAKSGSAGFQRAVKKAAQRSFSPGLSAVRESREKKRRTIEGGLFNAAATDIFALSAAAALKIFCESVYCSLPLYFE